MRTLPAIAVAVVVAAPGLADWLAFKDGSTSETVGPWKVDKGRVVFKVKGGALQAIRVEEVDLELSTELTQRAGRDRGIVELKSAPEEIYERHEEEQWQVVPVTEELVVAIREKTVSWDLWGLRPGSSCLPARVVGIATGGEVLVQIGTSIHRLQVVGVDRVDRSVLREIAGGQDICIGADPAHGERDAEGRLVGYVQLAEGRDLGLELLHRGAAAVASGDFALRSRYLEAAHR